jgi:hypothetical protein
LREHEMFCHHCSSQTGADHIWVSPKMPATWQKDLDLKAKGKIAGNQ